MSRFASKAIRVVLLSTVLVLAFSPAWSALNFTVRIDGEVQGWIQGDITLVGRENLIEGNEFHHLMEVPAGSTLVDHQTVVFTKPLDRATPKLLQAMDTSEFLTVVFHFYRPSQTGAEEEYYNVTLERARVVSIEPILPNNKIPENLPLLFSERIRIAYDAITETWLPTGGSYTAAVPRP